MLDVRSQGAFHSGVMRLYKRLLQWDAQRHASDDRILALVQLPSPSELLRRARLRYLGTLAGCSASAEWGLLAADESWWASIAP